MSYKNLRYSHQCSPEPPVKKQARPKAKQAPKPKAAPTPIYEEEEKEKQPQQVKFKIVKPQPKPNPVSALSQHYQLLQNEYIKQKQEKQNNLGKNMFVTKRKKR